MNPPITIEVLPEVAEKIEKARKQSRVPMSFTNACNAALSLGAGPLVVLIREANEKGKEK